MTVPESSETDGDPPGTAGGDWTRATLPLFILGTLQDGPSYGYAIGARLTRSGLGEVRGSTLYPLLARQQHAGFVKTQWRPGDGGPGRKYFSLTPAGEAELDRLRREWRDFVRRADSYISPDRRVT